MRSVLVAFAGALLVTACSGAGRTQRIANASGTSATLPATLSLKSALIEMPSEVIVSCRGGGLCRETVAPPDAKDAIEDAQDDCKARGGLLGNDACPRTGTRASCTLGGGVGPIRVFTYEEEHVERMTDLCGAADGELHLGR